MRWEAHGERRSVEIDTRHWIGGKRVDSAERFQSISPIDETVIAEVASGGAPRDRSGGCRGAGGVQDMGRTSREDVRACCTRSPTGVEANTSVSPWSRHATTVRCCARIAVGDAAGRA